MHDYTNLAASRLFKCITEPGNHLNLPTKLHVRAFWRVHTK